MLIIFIYQHFVNDFSSYMQKLFFIKTHQVNTKQDGHKYLYEYGRRN